LIVLKEVEVNGIAFKLEAGRDTFFGYDLPEGQLLVQFGGTSGVFPQAPGYGEAFLAAGGDGGLNVCWIFGTVHSGVSSITFDTSAGSIEGVPVDSSEFEAGFFFATFSPSVSITAYHLRDGAGYTIGGKLISSEVGEQLGRSLFKYG